MKITRMVLFFIAAVLIAGICAWILRGEYDRHFMMEGRFHIMSNAKMDHRVDLHFPSGRNLSFNLKKGGSADFNLPDTGEGAITIAIDGIERDHVGYVTSMNSLVVLVIGEEKTEFSQIFPSLGSELNTAANGASLNR